MANLSRFYCKNSMSLTIKDPQEEDVCSNAWVLDMGFKCSTGGSCGLILLLPLRVHPLLGKYIEIGNLKVPK